MGPHPMSFSEVSANAPTENPTTAPPAPHSSHPHQGKSARLIPNMPCTISQGRTEPLGVILPVFLVTQFATGNPSGVAVVASAQTLPHVL